MWFMSKQVHSHSITTKTSEIQIPILYSNSSFAAAYYLVDSNVAQQFLPEKLEINSLPFTSSVFVGLYVFDYRNSSIGSYKEISLVVPTKKKGVHVSVNIAWYDFLARMYHASWVLPSIESKHTGVYYISSAVTAPHVASLSSELWGIHRYVADISTDFSSISRFEADIAGELKTSGNTGFFSFSGFPFSILSLHTADDMQGKQSILRTSMEVGHKLIWGGHRSCKTSVTGSGPLSDTLSALGLHDIAPVFTARSDEFSGVLPLGKFVDKT